MQPVNPEATFAGDFRKDLNGLRAWAVLGVVLYHFSVPGITGGFAGVDVFFVISGYLMYGIISTGLMRGDFSLGRFYLARARRIFPALIVLCLIMLVFGWVFLMPEEYRQLGRHARESLTFTSNLQYLSESGYFDVASQEKWLLHTWSLAVEWQFYMLLPLLMLVSVRLLPGGEQSSRVLLLGLCCVSLALCVWLSRHAADQAFYSIQTRAWEMLAGALVCMLGRPGFNRVQQRMLESLGLLLIVLTFTVFDKHRVWPGWHASLPVAGSMLNLLAARPESIWTTSPALQWVGTRSYSIYLWHWPLVVALAYVERLQQPLWVATAIRLSIVLGHASYRWIEVPSRHWLSRISAVMATSLLLAVLLVMIVLAQQVRQTGFPARLPAEVAVIEAERENHNPRLRECLDPQASCVYGVQPVRAAVVGDSHADAVVTAVQAALPDAAGGVLFRGGSGCAIVFGMRSAARASGCDGLKGALEQELAALPVGVPVILAGRTSEYVHGGNPHKDAVPSFYFDNPQSHFSQQLLQQFSSRYVETLCRIAEDRPVYVLRPIPEMPVDVPTAMGRGLLLGEFRLPYLPMADYLSRHAFVIALQDQAVERCGVKILDPLPWLCNQDVCHAGDQQLPWYRDHDHLSEHGNRRLIEMFREVFAGSQ